MSVSVIEFPRQLLVSSSNAAIGAVGIRVNNAYLRGVLGSLTWGYPRRRVSSAFAVHYFLRSCRQRMPLRR
jgi:hypothetical protein